MIVKIADNIISPLGSTSEENFKAVVAGKSMLQRHDSTFGLPEAFCGSLLNRDEISKRFDDLGTTSKYYTIFEKLCILSATEALKECDIDPANSDVVFVLSTTKGNVDCLSEDLEDSRCYLAGSANKINEYFGNYNTPIVASNACISGVCAQITAIRQLFGGRYHYAIVIGCDILSKFIISGFQSFKALSVDPCRPYDKDRVGLNLGEAVGTIILKSVDKATDGDWQFVACSIHNDANHISGPSRTGEGSFRVLNDILKSTDINDIAFVNAHGTATAYNDEMESIAIHRAGLDVVPVNGFKGYYGHTLGAAGVIEVILSMKAVDNGIVPATKGFETTGTSYALNVSNQPKETSKRSFIKILSGFGGSNAGICYRKGGSK